MKKALTHQNSNTFQNVFTGYHYTNSHFPPHFHHNYELIYAITGQATVMLNGQKQVLRQEEFLLLPSYQVHELLTDASSHIWVATFSPNYIKKFTSIISNKRAVDPIFKVRESTRRLLTDNLIAPFGKAVFLNELQPEFELMLKACLYAVCAEYLQTVTLVPNNREAETVTFRILQYIADNFKEDISLRDIAKHSGYTYQYVSKSFNEIVGFNFKTVLNQYRFEYALRLLEETDLPITQVAMESGFQSLRTFNRVSEEIYRLSPTELRKKARALALRP